MDTLSYNGLYLSHSNHSLLKENSIEDCAERGVYILSCLNITLDSNTIMETRYGVWLFYSDDCILQNNSIAGNNGNGLYLYNSHQTLIDANEIVNNGENGILMQYSSHNNLTGNSATGNKEYGLYLYSSNWNTITYNDFTSNELGCYLEVLSKGNVFDSNECDESEIDVPPDEPDPELEWVLIILSILLIGGLFGIAYYNLLKFGKKSTHRE